MGLRCEMSGCPFPLIGSSWLSGVVNTLMFYIDHVDDLWSSKVNKNRKLEVYVREFTLGKVNSPSHAPRPPFHSTVVLLVSGSTYRRRFYASRATP